MEESQKELLELLKEGITPATGCTEPIAVAYAVAVAKEQIEGNLESIHVQVDSNIYKNGLFIGSITKQLNWICSYKICFQHF